MSAPKCIRFRNALYTIYPTEEEPVPFPTRFQESEDLPAAPQRSRSRHDVFELKRLCDRLGVLCQGGKFAGSWRLLLPDGSWLEQDSTEDAYAYLSKLGK